MKDRSRREGWLFGPVDETATFGGVLAAEDAGDGFGVGDVLLLEDAGREGFVGVVVVDGDGFLEDDDAVVYGLVDEMDCAASDLCPVVECLVLGVEAGEGGEQ